MVKIHLAALVVAGLSVAGCEDSAAETIPRPPPRGITVKTCRGTCFVFRTLKCGDVEEACGHMHGVLVLDGLPYDCTQVEPVACRLTGGIESCLAQCGDGETSDPVGKGGNGPRH